MQGIGVSAGVAIAPVFKIEEPKIVISQRSVAAAQALANLKLALAKTQKQILQTEKLVSQRAGKAQGAIFQAHLDILKDPALIEDIEKLIKSQNLNAAAAVDKISKKYIALFEKMEDLYFRERAADIKDVSKRLLYNLLDLDLVDLSLIDQEVIIVAEDLSPSQTGLLNKKFVKGFLTNYGGKTSHTAIVAQSLGIPAIVGLENLTQKVKTGTNVAFNGSTGRVYIDPNQEELKTLKALQKAEAEENKELLKYRHQKSFTLDQKRIEIAANLETLEDLKNLDKSGAEAIGLFRTEFLYMEANNWPSEKAQFEAYKKVLEAIPERVVIRTLDIGGDKNLKYYQFSKELNPFLGNRAIRFSLSHEAIFKKQLRALLRASQYGKLAIMFPMIATLEELLAAKKLLKSCQKELEEEGVQFSKAYEIGMMMEIPAAALLSATFAEHVDFVSIGTNDLIQYTMAADRINAKVNYLYQPLNPAIIKLIKIIVDGAHLHNKWVGMCGAMAGDLEATKLLVGLGLDELSMSQNLILKVKKQILKTTYEKTQALANLALKAKSSEEIKKIITSEQ